MVCVSGHEWSRTFNAMFECDRNIVNHDSNKTAFVRTEVFIVQYILNRVSPGI